MCGIFGFKLNRSLNESDLKHSIKHLNLLSNRGPDNQGYYIDKENGVFLGHTRLSIIDLSEQSNQPFISGNSVIVYNGEVYNYKEIKEDLNDKNFFTNSDTEVLLSLWQNYKLDGLRKIDGMFAFAIYENKEGVFVNTNQSFTRLYDGDLSWVDLNKDGYLDLVVSGYKSKPQTKVYISKNEAQTFETTDDYGLPQLFGTKMAWGDLDNDGDIDLAISGIDENENYVFVGWSGDIETNQNPFEVKIDSDTT